MGLPLRNSTDSPPPAARTSSIPRRLAPSAECPSRRARPSTPAMASAPAATTTKTPRERSRTMHPSFPAARLPLLAALLLHVGPLYAAGPPAWGPRPLYRFPEIMVIVYADFPNEPEHQLALAKYTASHGFNCVEAE